MTNSVYRNEDAMLHARTQTKVDASPKKNRNCALQC